VDVRLLLPTPRREHFVFRFAGRRHYGSLLAAGVRIFEYQPSFLHAKYALTDRDWAMIGSSNLDSLSSFVNLEADMEVRSKGAVRALATRFVLDTRAAHEITRVGPPPLDEIARALFRLLRPVAVTLRRS